MKIVEQIARWLVLKSGFISASNAAAVPAVVDQPKPDPHLTSARLDAAIAKARQMANGNPARVNAAPLTPAQVYTLPTPPPGVLPSGMKLAMDDASGWRNPAGAWSVAWAFHEGIGFMGYPYLAELAQRPEYRRGSEIIAKEMTRKWITLTYTGDDDSNQKQTEEKLAAVENEMKRLNVRSAFRKLAELDGYFGRSHLYIDLGDVTKEELQKSIGNGHDDLSQKKIKKGSLRSLKVIEPMWTYPNAYNSSDPLHENYYRPENWFVQGRLIDSSRLLTFVGREVSDLLKPAYTFGGLSLTQMAKPYVDNWLQARQSVSDLLQSFTVFELATDMQAVLAGDFDQTEIDNFFNRVELFNLCRSNRGLFITNKDTETFDNVSAPLASLDKLQAQAQEHMAACFGIPLVKLFGITPSGLNASSDGEIRCFYDWIEAQQESEFTDPLSRVINFIQLSLWGEIDPNIGFKFNPLWTLDALQMATKRKTDMEHDQIAIDAGVIETIESRTRLAAEEDGPFSALDLGKEIIPPDDGDDDLLDPEGSADDPRPPPSGSGSGAAEPPKQQPTVK